MMKKYLIFIPLFLLILFADQYSKWWVLHHFFEQNTYTPFLQWLGSKVSYLAPFETSAIHQNLNIVTVWNKGISFGFLSSHDDPETMSHILIILSFIIMGFFLTLFHNSIKTLQHIGVALIIGGAVGNICDRFRFGAVYDFLDFHHDGWHYPAFNIADSAITVGVILYIIGGMIGNSTQNNFVKKVGRWHAK